MIFSEGKRMAFPGPTKAWRFLFLGGGRGMDAPPPFLLLEGVPFGAVCGNNGKETTLSQAR